MQSGQPAVVYKHVWHQDLDDDDEEGEEGGDRKKRDDQSGTTSQPYARQAHRSTSGQNPVKIKNAYFLKKNDVGKVFFS